MNVADLHKAYVAKWPNIIRINDGYASGSGFIFPSLSRSHQAIEDSIDHKIDHWGNIVTWSMFQASHERAQELREQGATELRISDVSLATIERWIMRNLSGEDWAEQRAQYVTLGSNNSQQADFPDGRRPELKR
ncbi:MAG: hypothetical protein U1F55_09665 [Chitinivorax sp.]|jgi:hypothetical protein